MLLQCGRFELLLDRPLVMGIVNVTPDSFSDGGRFVAADDAIAHARSLISEGADILDIGGESTRPGAEPVDAAQEWRRIAPVLEALAGSGVPLSVDTRHAAVMRKALDLGADMINDVHGFLGDGAVDAVAGSSAALCVMHMRGDPRTMQKAPVYADVVEEVLGFLQSRIQVLRDAGVCAGRLLVDPGIGFGKTLDDNLALLAASARFAQLAPVLVGVSRKSMIGQLTGQAMHDRLAGSIAGALAAVAHGASVVRVHDVAATRAALAVWSAIDDAVRQASTRKAGEPIGK